MRMILVTVSTLALVLSGSIQAKDRKARLGRLNCEAGEIAKFNGRRWRCAADAEGPQFVLRDANGDQVGTVLDISQSTASSSVFFVESFYSPARGEDISLVLVVRSPEDQIGPSGIFFESEDCTGTPWLPASGIYFHLLTPGFVATTTGELYAPLDDPPERVTAKSLMQGQLGCRIIQVDDRIERTLVAGEVVDPNLYDTFPPPYTLELE